MGRSHERGSAVGDFVYEQLAQRVVFGWGRLDTVSDEIDRFGAQRVMVISERSTKPIADELREQLGGRVAVTIPEVRPHVPRADVDDARTQAIASSVDLVLTIGGGSATGLGKAIALEYPVSSVAIPTTYAGSEMTPIYGITESSRKLTGRDDRVLPQTVIYDPEVTTSLPARVTAGSGMNAIAHSVEALYAESSNPVSSLLAETSIKVLGSSLRGCIIDHTDRAARSEALYGAYLAGTVLASSGMALHHRICHVLGGRFDFNHGDMNAVLLAHVVAFNEPAAPQAIARVAQALGGEESASAALFELSESLKAPTSLRELGLNASDIEESASLVADGDFYNPRPVDRAALAEILTAAFEGRRPARGSP